MSGEAWSCFARLPPGLIDPSVSLTLNWLKPKPTLAGFQLARDDIDEDAYHRNLRVQRQARSAAFFLASVVLIAVGANLTFDLELFADQRTFFTGVWAATTCFFLAVLLYGLCAVPIWRFRGAEGRRIAFAAAVAEFAEIDAWREVRCSAAFWSDELDPKGFEREAAELMVGVYKTGQVGLTRDRDDYGVDVLACAQQRRLVAQCKQWKSQKIGAPIIRELAGAKAYFDADQAMLICLQGPSEDSEQCNRFIERQNLAVWNLDALVGFARHMRENGNGEPIA